MSMILGDNQNNANVNIVQHKALLSSSTKLIKDNDILSVLTASLTNGAPIQTLTIDDKGNVLDGKVSIVSNPISVKLETIIRLDIGMAIECSPNTSVLTSNGWFPAGYIRKDMLLRGIEYSNKKGIKVKDFTITEIVNNKLTFQKNMYTFISENNTILIPYVPIENDVEEDTIMLVCIHQ